VFGPGVGGLRRLLKNLFRVLLGMKLITSCFPEWRKC